MLTRSFLIALAAALLLAAPAGSTPSAAQAASFKDAAGDSGAAPDITDVDVGNDVVAGPIVFWITLANRPNDLGPEDIVFLLVDADRNPATGDDTGAEYLVFVDSESAGMAGWDGEEFVDLAAPSLKVHFLKAQRLLRVEVHPRDLGNVGAFAFNVLSANGDDVDWAPNGPPSWSYTPTSGKPPLAVLGIALNPKAPTAGKQLTVAVGVGRGDILDLLVQGKVTCTLTVGGMPLKAARAAFVRGVPQCVWNLPKTAKGKLLKGKISVSYGGSTATRSFSARVR